MKNAVRILFFAQAREAAGHGEVAIALDEPITQAQFWSMAMSVSPALAAMQKISRLARHGTYLQTDELIHPGDEIAVIPPVSGG